MRLRLSNEIPSVRQARRSLSVVRRRLLDPTPEALEGCTSHLQTAIDTMAQLQERLQEAPARPPLELGPEFGNELHAFRHELTQMNALMRNAGAFHTPLANLLLPQPDNSICYGAGGIVAARPESTLRLEG